MTDFFQQYFVDPIIQGTGYNIYNTLAYAAILVVAVFVTYKVLKKLKIHIDNRFFVGVLPYIILGGLLRALEDAGSYGFWFKTPIIYILIFVLAFAGLLVAKLMEKRIEYHKAWFVIGAVFVAWSLLQVYVSSAFAFVAMVSLTIFWAVLLVLIKKISDRYYPKLSKFMSWENTAILGVHMFDASTTFTALTYFPYFEQHVLPGFLIGIFGPAVMFVLKFAVVGAVLYVLDKDLKDIQQRKFIKLVIMILGLAPGLRNFFRLVMGV